MSQREIQIQGNLQQWRGVDQRSQPTLVQDGFFVMARGIFFGLGDNAERLTGKKLAGVLPTAVFNIAQHGNVTFIQLFDSLCIVPTEELVDLDVVLDPTESIQDDPDDLDIQDEFGFNITDDA